MKHNARRVFQFALLAGASLVAFVALTHGAFADSSNSKDAVTDDAAQMLADGRHTFRFDTFGDEDFWGGTLQLHTAIEGSKFKGGVGPGVSPAMALAVGLK